MHDFFKILIVPIAIIFSGDLLFPQDTVRRESNYNDVLIQENIALRKQIRDLSKKYRKERGNGGSTEPTQAIPNYPPHQEYSPNAELERQLDEAHQEIRNLTRRYNSLVNRNSALVSEINELSLRNQELLRENQQKDSLVRELINRLVDLNGELNAERERHLQTTRELSEVNAQLLETKDQIVKLTREKSLANAQLYSSSPEVFRVRSVNFVATEQSDKTGGYIYCELRSPYIGELMEAEKENNPKIKIELYMLKQFGKNGKTTLIPIDNSTTDPNGVGGIAILDSPQDTRFGKSFSTYFETPKSFFKKSKNNHFTFVLKMELLRESMSPIEINKYTVFGYLNNGNTLTFGATKPEMFDLLMREANPYLFSK